MTFRGSHKATDIGVHQHRIAAFDGKWLEIAAASGRELRGELRRDQPYASADYNE